MENEKISSNTTANTARFCGLMSGFSAQESLLLVSKGNIFNKDNSEIKLTVEKTYYPPT